MSDDGGLSVSAKSVACGNCTICGEDLYQGMDGSNWGMGFDTPSYKARWCSTCTGKAFALLAKMVTLGGKAGE